MSRIGKLPINIPTGVKVLCANNEVLVEGPKGKMKISLCPQIKIENKDNVLLVSRNGESKDDKSKHGLYRVMISNMVEGVSKGFEKRLEINGTGFKASVQGKNAIFNLGFSHTIEYDIPEGIKIVVEENTKVIVSGVDKQLVGHVAAVIRMMRPPEPYKGKGIKYLGEVIRRKAGKASKK
jgi:large subunit ribosomal protein L6